MHEGLYEIKDKLCSELCEFGKKEKLDTPSLQMIDTLAHALKNVCKIIDCYEDEGSYSGASRMPYNYGYDNMSYARGRGANARRDSMGRYSRNGGNFQMEMQELMQQAPNEYVRQKMMDAINGI